MTRVAAFASALGLVGIAVAVAFAPSAQSRFATAKATPAMAAAAMPADGATTDAPRPTLEARRDPVPVLMKPRPAVALASAEAPLPPVAAPPTESAADGASAKAAVELDGYRNVRLVRRGDNGLWYAEGLRGSTKVMLTVDARGTVSAQ